MTVEKLIYLATPYSHPSERTRRSRYAAACRIAGELMAKGHVVFSPIAHSHGIACEVAELGLDFEAWAHQDLAMLGRCDLLVVVPMDGYLQSVGIAFEVEAATQKGLPVKVLTTTPDGTPGLFRPPMSDELRAWAFARHAAEASRQPGDAHGREDG